MPSTSSKKPELIPMPIPLRTFKVAVVPDKRRMVTASDDKTLRLWDLKTGDVLAVSRDGQLIASGDDDGVLASGSWDKRRNCGTPKPGSNKQIRSGVVIRSTAFNIRRLENFLPSQQTAIFKFIIQAQENASHPSRLTHHTIGHSRGRPMAHAFSQAAISILPYANGIHHWQQVGNPWQGHSLAIYAIAVNPAGTLVASASGDNDVRIWQLFDQRTVATFRHSSCLTCVTFSVDGKHILSGGGDKMITEWAIAITPFAKSSQAKLDKMMWEDALLDAQKVIELDPSSHIGYQLTHAALHGLQRYDEAIDAFTIMLSKLDHAPEAKVRDLRQLYIHPSRVEDAIQRAVWKELEYAPTTNNAFKASAEYKELLSSTTKHSDLKTAHQTCGDVLPLRPAIHRWEETEAVLPDIQDKVVYELNGLGGIAKLQSFCKVARDAGYRWAWMDTCCIDKRSNTEVQESVNSMFVWYRHSALTIVYLSDVPPSSKPGALARSIWNERGWTFQEFVAPKVVIFYQNDWSLYLGDRSPNHKESSAIMKELENATGIDAHALVTFRPGMSAAREKLQWASKRVTTLQEDVAYSLFGIFGITLPVIYGERRQSALGRLLQEIVARSGDISVLDWIGQPSEFNSCLPADITSYTTPPRTLPPLSDYDIRTQVSSLRQTMDTDLALELYDQLEQLSAPRFANCRLHLPCISFRITEVGPSRGLARDTYHIKAEGLNDLLITTKEPLLHFSRSRLNRRTLLLVRPWDRYLLEVSDFAEQPDSTDDWESTEALRLMVHLRQPFNAFY
ncbi:hypothetical protein BDR07DRAFT_1434241 [Suillus spraguei]|nr:hypothetical protein BDR07DRAFT_1434241 [Suillus spraguei]